MTNEQRSPQVVAPAPAQPSQPHRYRWAVLAVVLAADVMDMLDATITSIAAPAIAAGLGGGPALSQWLQAAYTLPFAVLLITAGRLGDRYGRHRLFLIGTLGFTAASAVCSLATTPGWLIGGRVLQGALGALLLPQGFGILKETFEGAELGRALGFFGPVLGLCSVGGPVLGGMLVGADPLGTGWRAIFLVNLPVGLLTAAGAVRWIRRSPADPGLRMDVPGMLLTAAASAAVIFPLVQGAGYGWPWWCPGLMAAGAAGFVLFARLQPRRPSPLVLPSLLRNRGYTGGLLVVTAFYAAFSGLMLVLSLFLQGPLGLSPQGAGYAVAPLAAGIVLTAGPGQALAERSGRRAIQAGIVVTVCGLVLLAALAGPASWVTSGWRLLPATLVIGMGMGLVIPPLFDVVLVGVSEPETGSAAGVLNAVQQLANSVGVALLVTVWAACGDHGRTPGGALAGTAWAAAALLAVALLASYRLPARPAPHPRAAADH
ncbi:MFS transporter [Streptomyces sp. PCS3-D2]|uniref:MFS transporter n=1 Tax=Streptomyces sp. PCS3-D2 TaxID=1460244 RepID=UPI0004492A20|nr:MFS transporter [Streptomyces sp. PCS3-D2]WKV75207.1 MFS transporter [Streptomyces sp. PCS3-D2]